MNTDVVLGEDHFLIATHQIDPTQDTVVAYSRTDGEVEALLLQGGVISQLYRDPTAAGGWNVRAVDGAIGVSDMVAGMAGPVGSETLNIFYCDKSGTMTRAVEQPDQTFRNVGTPLDWSEAGPMQLSTAPFQNVNTGAWFTNLLVVCMKASTVPPAAPVPAELFFLYTNDVDGDGLDTCYGSYNGFDYHPDTGKYAVSISRGSVLSVPALFLFLPDSNPQATVQVWWTPLLDGEVNGTLLSFLKNNIVCPPIPTGAAGDEPEIITDIDYAATLGAVRNGGGGYLPLAVARSVRNNVWILAYTPATFLKSGVFSWVLAYQNPGDSAADVQLQPALRVVPHAGSGDVARVFDLFVLNNGELGVVRQQYQGDPIADNTAPVFNPAVPLLNDVTVLSGQTGPSSGNELIIVAANNVLQAWTKDPVSGTWSDRDVHLPSTESLQVSTYRVRLDLLDNWGAPASAQSLQITASTPATALFNGQAVGLNQSATTVRTDNGGHVTLALITEGLGAPTLTVSSPSLAPVSIYPSGPVTTYLGGSGSLNTVPAVTATVLSTATTSSGAPVAPGLANDTTGKAQQAVTQMSATASCVPAAQTPPPLGGVPPRHHHHHHHHHRRRPRRNTRRVGGLTLSLTDLWDDVKQGIKTAAATITAVEVDITTRVVTIGGDFGAWVDSELPVIINDIEDAAHVFHALFNWIAAEVADAIEWLEAKVLALLKDTLLVAQTFNGYLSDDLASFARHWIGMGRGKTVKWLTNERQSITDNFTNAANQVGATTLSGAQSPDALTASTRVRRHRRGKPVGLTATADVSGAANGAHAHWLADKLRELTPQLAAPVAIPDNFLATFADAQAQLTSAGGELYTSAKNIINDIVQAVENPKDLLSTTLAELITQVGGLIDGLIDLAIGVVEGLFDVLDLLLEMWQNVLTTTLTELPLIGSLLASLNNDFSDITIGQLGCLLVAFPFVIVWELTQDGDLPFTTASTVAASRKGHRGAPQIAPPADAWNIVAGIATLFDGINDVFELSYTVPKSYGPPSNPPLFCSVTDVALPGLTMQCQYPGIGRGHLNDNPPVLDDRVSIMNFVSWLTDVMPPVIAGFSLVVGTTTDEAFAGLREDSNDVCFLSYFVVGLVSMALGFDSCGLSNISNAGLWIEAFTGNIGNVANLLDTTPFKDDPVFGELGLIACLVLVGAGALATAIIIWVEEPG